MSAKSKRPKSRPSKVSAARSAVSGSELPEVAYYYPEPFWRSEELIKNLLLVFDGVALLIPRYMKSRRADLLGAHLSEPLEDQKLLHILEPEKLVDAAATERLSAVVSELLDSGDLAKMARDKGSRFREISYSRMGGFGNHQIADALIKRLKEQGLAKDSEDGASIPLNPVVRQVVLALLSQILRPQARQIGLELAPVTDDPRLTGALDELLSLRLKSVAPGGLVVSSDLEVVGVDLSDIPLDEILDYKRTHIDMYKEYRRAVRRFVNEVSNLEPAERKRAEEDRREELRDIAAKVRKVARSSWKRPATFALGATGAAWKLAVGDPLSAALAAGAALLGLGKKEADQSGAFSYLFSLPRGWR